MPVNSGCGISSDRQLIFVARSRDSAMLRSGLLSRLPKCFSRSASCVSMFSVMNGSRPFSLNNLLETPTALEASIT